MKERREILRKMASALELDGAAVDAALRRLAEVSRTFLGGIAEAPAYVAAGTGAAVGDSGARDADRAAAAAGDSDDRDVDGASLALRISERGVGVPTALDELWSAATGAPGIAPTNPRFLGYIPGGGLPTAALADYVAALTNRYVGYHATAPTATRLENEVVSWLVAAMGLPDGAWGTLTSGGSAANLLGMLAARTRLPRSDRWRARVYLTDQAHMAVARGLRILGFEGEQLRFIPVDAQQRLRVDALRLLIEEDRSAGHLPWMVCATAGTTNTGAVDPLADVHALCRAESLWFHIDAAYGGFFRLCPETRELLAPLALADSIALDPHKGLFMPYGTGAVLVADGRTLKGAVAEDAAYLSDVQSADASSPADYSFELTRPFRGARVWLSLRAFGVETFQAALSEKLLLARELHAALASVPGLQRGTPPELSVVTFRIDGDNRALLAKILTRGRVHVSSTVIDGVDWLRACVLCFRTHAEAVEALVDELRHALAQRP